MEVRLMLEQMIDDWFAECASHYNNFIKALLAGDVKAMNSYMNKVALATSELLPPKIKKSPPSTVGSLGFLWDGIFRYAFGKT